MVHTVPDYSGKYRLESLYGNIDNAEVAARLGSINTFDRRGLVIWMDDFEGATSRWVNATAGVGTAIALVTTHQLSGVQSMSFDTGAVAGNYAGIHRWLAYPTISPFGFQIALDTSGDMDYYEMTIDIYTGAVYYRGRIRLDQTNTRLMYYNSAGVQTTFQATFPLASNDYCFNILKLVIDISTGYYSRFIVNNVEYDLSTNLLYTAASANNPFVLISFIGYAKLGTAENFYLDDAIVTVDEPL